MSNRDKYRACAIDCPSIPLFLLPWWMDAVCGETNWDVCLSFDKGVSLRGILVYCLKTKLGLRYIVNPPLTPYTGPWLNYKDGMTPYERNSFEKQVILELLDQLPYFNFMKQRCHYSLTNWLPFHWQGFKQSTNYTYKIEDIELTEQLFDSVHKSQQKKIKKAIKEGIKIIRGRNLFNAFYDLYQISCSSNNINFYLIDFFQKLHDAIQANNSGDIFIAIDEKAKVHACSYILWDSKTLYNWVPASEPTLRKSGAMALLIWEVLKVCSSDNKVFDLEGSMQPGIEQFFSSFGTTQTPCFVLTKSSNFFLETLLLIKNRWL